MITHGSRFAFFASLATFACSSLACAPAAESTAPATGALTESDAGDSAAAADVEAGASDADAGAPTFVDPRDQKVYRTITMGGHTWLGANLGYVTSGSYCYDDDEASCEADGRLYTLAVARRACPAGWHVATDADWQSLERALGMSEADLAREGYETPRGTAEGEWMKSDEGFAAKLAGYRGQGAYDARGDRTYFWANTTRGSEVWRRRVAANEPTIFRFTNPPLDFAISVRCVRDAD